MEINIQLLLTRNLYGPVNKGFLVSSVCLVDKLLSRTPRIVFRCPAEPSEFFILQKFQAHFGANQVLY
jgi:hypothetical protein